MLLEWLADFRKSTSSSSTANPEELVAFDIVCGDLNFDNCSSGEAGFLPIQGGSWGRVGVPVTASNTVRQLEELPAPCEHVGGMSARR